MFSPCQVTLLAENISWVIIGLPWFNLDQCQGCKLCARACPRGCISLSEPSARVLVGGKLGRHPHLARPIATVDSPEQAIAVIEPVMLDYISSSRSGERFGDYWARTREEV